RRDGFVPSDGAAPGGEARGPRLPGLAGGMFLAAVRTRACAVRRSPAIAMRLPYALLGLLALVAFPAGSAGGDALARCERRILGGSDAYFARRGAALARCVAKAARCPAAFASQATAAYPAGRGAALARCGARAARCPAAFASQATAADDPCLAAVAGRCQARLAAARRAGARLEGVGARCTEPRPHGFGVPAVSFFD